MSIDTSYPIYVVESWGMTAMMAAQDFAAHHFAEPRRLAWYDPESGTFQLADGVSRYRVVAQAAVPEVSRATFGVFRLKEGG